MTEDARSFPVFGGRTFSQWIEYLQTNEAPVSETEAVARVIAWNFCDAIGYGRYKFEDCRSENDGECLCMDAATDAIKAYDAVMKGKHNVRL